MSGENSSFVSGSMSRRTFASSLAVAAAAGIVAASGLGNKAMAAEESESAASAPAAGGALTPGTYQATKHGFMGENTVYTTFDDKSIVSVAVGESTDMPKYLTQFPIAEMPKRIVEAQSVKVDVVSGATFTSNAILSAVKDCIKQAGGEGMFEDEPKAVEKTAGEAVETDVLVIGGGMSGCMSALSAAQSDFDGVASGLSVTLVEKQDFLGGSCVLAYGGFFTGSPLSTPPKQSYIDSQEERFQYLNINNKVNKPLLTSLMNTAGETTLKMQQIGVPLNTTGLDGEGRDSIPLSFNGDATVMYPIGLDWRHNWGVGRHYVDVFNTWWEVFGVDVRTRTAVTELIIDGGKVTGAKVEGPDSTYEIHAKKVILSCGGFAQNREMIEEFTPHDAKSQVWSNGGSDGDGIRMGIAAGGHTVGDRLWGHVASTNIHGFHGVPDIIISENGFMVNKEGKTFVANGNDNSIAYAGIAEQTDQCAFTIVDSENPHAAELEAAMGESDYKTIIFKGDTLEDLAAAAEIDPAGLKATIDEYNNHLATRGEVDPMAFDLIENPEFAGALPVEKGPFYAAKFIQVHLGSCVGLVVDDACRVLDSDNNPIANLFATGECCIGGNMFDYHVGGWGIGGAAFSGRLAGEAAKKEIQSA